ILSYDDLSVMEVADLVNTIDGLTEEQATAIVARAEVLAEEPTEELPRRKSGRGAAALLEGQREPTAAADGATVGETGESEAAPGEEPDHEREENDASDASIDDDDSASPAEPRGAIETEEFSNNEVEREPESDEVRSETEDD